MKKVKIIGNLSQIKSYFDFIWTLTEKEIKVRYKKAFFGFLWIIINPLLQMLIIGIIFSFFIKTPDYFLFLFSGLLPWTFFSISLNKTTPSIVYERNLLQKAKFSIEAIPISIVLSNFMHILLSLLIFIPFIFLTKEIFFPQILFIIPALFWLLIITISISLITSSLNVYYRDINFFTQTSVNLLFYATPILYPLDIIPQTFTKFLTFNPLTSIFQLFHYSLIGIDIPQKDTLILNIIESFILIFIGILIFRKKRKYFVDLL